MAKIDTNSINVITQNRISGGDAEFFIGSINSIVDRFGGGPTDVIVKRLYDRNDFLINSIISTDIPAYDKGKISVDPELDITEFGFSSGEFKIIYNFWRILVGDVDSPGVYISEISPSKTEVRLLPTKGNEDRFKRFANASLSDAEINKMLDYIFKPPTEAYPFTGFIPEQIISENLTQNFKEELFKFDRHGSASPIEMGAYFSYVLPNKLDLIISNTRQSTFEFIRLNGISDQTEFKEILKTEFKNNIRVAFGE